MKSFHYFSLFCFLLFGISCGSDDGSPVPDSDVAKDDSLLVGIYEGVSFTATVPSGIVATALSGEIIFEGDGSYSSTISPFSLNENSGTWTYEQEDKIIIFNEGEAIEEMAENVTLTPDSLFFRISRGEENNRTIIDFRLAKQE